MNSFTFDSKVINTLAKVLGVNAINKDNGARFELTHADSRLNLNFELFSQIDIGGISQLHFCTACICSETLGEVTFIAESDSSISAIVIEREGGYSFYSNIDKKMLNADFATLHPEVMMTGVTLSLIEPVLGDGVSFDDIHNE
jgi:hypothetical protein